MALELRQEGRRGGRTRTKTQEQQIQTWERMYLEDPPPPTGEQEELIEDKYQQEEAGRNQPEEPGMEQRDHKDRRKRNWGDLPESTSEQAEEELKTNLEPCCPIQEKKLLNSCLYFDFDL